MAQQRLNGLLQEVLRCDVAGADAEVRLCVPAFGLDTACDLSMPASLAGYHRRDARRVPGPPGRAAQAACGAGGDPPTRGRCQPGLPCAPGRPPRRLCSTHRGASLCPACACVRRQTRCSARAVPLGAKTSLDSSGSVAVPSGGALTAVTLQPAPRRAVGQPDDRWEPGGRRREGGTGRRGWPPGLWPRGRQQQRCQAPAFEPAAGAVVRPPHGLPPGVTTAGAVAWGRQSGRCLRHSVSAAQRLGSAHAGACAGRV